MRAPVVLLTFVPVAVFAAILIALAAPPWPIYRWFGLALVVVGLTMLTIARVNLGNSFSITPRAQELVTSGVYSKIRHPVYVFSAIAIGGLLLYIRMPWLCLLLIPVAAIQVKRARAEERVLTDKFGEAYVKYKKGTWF
jgi:protein-S-isoprenylcysteine O-methyltransferase Ste14